MPILTMTTVPALPNFEKSKLGNRANVTSPKVTEHSKLHSSFECFATYCKIRYKFFSCFVVIGKGQVIQSLVSLIKTKYLQVLDNSFLHFLMSLVSKKKLKILKMNITRNQ